MRVRPFFWFLLAFICVSVLIFAATKPEYAPARLQVHIDQHPRSASPTTLELLLTDLQGIPIDEAQVISKARMTNMDMSVTQGKVTRLEAGTYLAEIHLYMAGPWEITVTAQADGFAPLHETVLVQVV